VCNIDCHIELHHDVFQKVLKPVADKWRNHNFLDKQFQVVGPMQPDPDGAESRIANAS
jgi:hypothetical protein